MLERAGRLIVAELKRNVAPDAVIVQALNYAADESLGLGPRGPPYRSSAWSAMSMRRFASSTAPSESSAAIFG